MISNQYYLKVHVIFSQVCVFTDIFHFAGIKFCCEIHNISNYSQVRFIAISNYLRVHIFAILLSFAEIIIAEINTRGKYVTLRVYLWLLVQ